MIRRTKGGVCATKLGVLSSVTHELRLFFRAVRDALAVVAAVEHYTCTRLGVVDQRRVPQVPPWTSSAAEQIALLDQLIQKRDINLPGHSWVFIGLWLG